MSPERISEEEWHSAFGHIERYRWAAAQIRAGETVLDVACGIGYGAELLAPTGCTYIGVDKPGVPSPTFASRGTFIEVDIEDWSGPPEPFDVAVCFETLEHVPTPAHLVRIISAARRLVLVSVPTVPTVGINEFHLRDYGVDDVPELFPDHDVREVVAQPSERSHLYALVAQ